MAPHRRSRTGTSALTRRGRSALVAGSFLVALGVVLSACGGGGSPGVASLGSTSTSSTTTLAGSSGGGPAPAKAGADLEKFASCMRSHGEPKFPSPHITAGGVSLEITPGSGVDPKSAKFAAAQAHCHSYLPAGIGHRVTLTAQDQADYLKAAECMRSHGIVSFPDPKFSGGSVQFVIPQGMSTTSSQFVKARLTCEKLIPAGLPYSS